MVSFCVKTSKPLTMEFIINKLKIGSMKRIFAVLAVLVLGIGTFHVPVADAKNGLLDFIFQTNSDSQADIEGFELPILPRPEAVKTIPMTVTAYSSRPAETDGSPFITADGSVVRDGYVATNVLPIGTKIRIPTLFGDKIFEVHDRMNARYSYRVDIWMPELKDAKQFGLKRNVKIEVIEMGNGKKNWEQWKGKGKELYRVGKYGPAAPPLAQPYLVAKADEQA